MAKYERQLRSGVCGDCIFWGDRFPGCNNFRASNLRKCDATGRKHWRGDDAENCPEFEPKKN